MRFCVLQCMLTKLTKLGKLGKIGQVVTGAMDFLKILPSGVTSEESEQACFLSRFLRRATLRASRYQAGTGEQLS